MLTFLVHAHLLDVLPLNNSAIFDWWRLFSPCISEISPGDDFILRKRPQSAILQVYQLQIFVGQILKSKVLEFQSLLPNKLAVLEPHHVAEIWGFSASVKLVWLGLPPSAWDVRS